MDPNEGRPRGYSNIKNKFSIDQSVLYFLYVNASSKSAVRTSSVRRHSPNDSTGVSLSLRRFQCAERSLAVKVGQKRREIDNMKTAIHEQESLGHSMEPLLSDHYGTLSAVCIASLILGLPLIANALWHLRVSSNASGRGVLRLIKLQYCINLLSIPAILIELGILGMPTKSMPSLVCLYLEWTVGFVRVNYYLAGLGIATCRYIYDILSHLEAVS